MVIETLHLYFKLYVSILTNSVKMVCGKSCASWKHARNSEFHVCSTVVLFYTVILPLPDEKENTSTSTVVVVFSFSSGKVGLHVHNVAQAGQVIPTDDRYPVMIFEQYWYVSFVSLTDTRKKS